MRQGHQTHGQGDVEDEWGRGTKDGRRHGTLHCDSATMKCAPLGKSVSLYDFSLLIKTMKLISAQHPEALEKTTR